MMSSPSIAPKVKVEGLCSNSLAVLMVDPICRFPRLVLLSYQTRPDKNRCDYGVILSTNYDEHFEWGAASLASRRVTRA